MCNKNRESTAKIFKTVKMATVTVASQRWRSLRAQKRCQKAAQKRMLSQLNTSTQFSLLKAKVKSKFVKSKIAPATLTIWKQ